MIGYQALADKLNSDLGLGGLFAAYLMRHHSPYSAEDLLAEIDLEVLILEFTQAIVYCVAKAKDDQIALYFEAPYDFSDWLKTELNQEPIWQAFKARQAMGAWALQNERGYYDALQLSFYSVEAGLYQVFQLEVRASQFLFYELQSLPMQCSSV